MRTIAIVMLCLMSGCAAVGNHLSVNAKYSVSEKPPYNGLTYDGSIGVEYKF